ncbi:hypothetical protein MMC07_001321 [Pseudocyphellaria aurata]|nr:hypothetical protein [Pseudocyphellaria aurata]
MALTNLGTCVVNGVTFQVPSMTDAELQRVTKLDFAYKLRSINTGLPHEIFVGDNLRSVFHVVLDRTYPISDNQKNYAPIRAWAWQQWQKSPCWNMSKTRALDFQFPNDNPSLLKNSKLWFEIKALKYRLPPLAKNLFTKPVPKIPAFVQNFRMYNIELVKFITTDVAREAFRLYIQSYFPHAHSSTMSRLLDEFDIQEGTFVPVMSRSCDVKYEVDSSLSSDNSCSANSPDKILRLIQEDKSNLLRRKKYIRILSCPGPNLEGSTSKSTATHLHLESSPTTTAVDVRAIPIKTSSIAIMFRGSNKFQKTMFGPSKRIEVMIDGHLKLVKIQKVKTLDDLDVTNWFMSVQSMEMTDGTELNTLLQRFFSNRSSLPVSIFRSDESHVLSDGGLFVDCDRLPLSLRKYDCNYWTLKIGAIKAVGVELAATCRMCNQTAKGSKGNRVTDRESNVLQRGSYPHSPEDNFKNVVRDSPLDRESSKDELELYRAEVEKGSKRKNEFPGCSKHAMPLTLTKRPRTERTNPDQSLNPKHLETDRSSNHVDPDRDEELVETDMLSALDAHLEQAQNRFRSTATSCRGLGSGST